MPQAPASPSPEPQAEAIAEAKAKAKEAAAKAAAVKEEMIDDFNDFIARVDREASAKATRRALQAGRPSSSAAPPESSADEEITGAFTAGRPGQANGYRRGHMDAPVLRAHL